MSNDLKNIFIIYRMFVLEETIVVCEVLLELGFFAKDVHWRWTSTIIVAIHNSNALSLVQNNSKD